MALQKYLLQYLIGQHHYTLNLHVYYITRLHTVWSERKGANKLPPPPPLPIYTLTSLSKHELVSRDSRDGKLL